LTNEGTSKRGWRGQREVSHLFGGEVVGDVEALPNLLRGLALLDVLGNSLAGQVQQILHVEEVGSLPGKM
jgi:hypothetical protein